MSRHQCALLIVALAGLPLLSACFQGYATPDRLQTAQRGPEACADSCRKFGLQMSAFVLVDYATVGCVCAPMNAPAGNAAAAGAAAGFVVVEQQRQQAASQQRPAK